MLVADFGGGTSDFSLIRFTRQGDTVTATPLGHAGVAVAGDSFDYRIINAVVSPRSAPISTMRRAFVACTTGQMTRSQNGYIRVGG